MVELVVFYDYRIFYLPVTLGRKSKHMCDFYLFINNFVVTLTVYVVMAIEIFGLSHTSVAAISSMLFSRRT